MAITFVGSATGSVINGGTLSVDLTAISGLAQDDIVVFLARSNNGTVVTPSGWTNIALNNVSLRKTSVGYKIMGGSPDSTLTLWSTSGTAADGGSAVVFAFRGVDTTTPLDVTSTLVEGASGAPNAPSITPTSNDCAIIAFGSSLTLAPTPSNLTNYSNTVVSTSDDTNDTTTAGAYRILVGGASSPEDPPAWGSWVGGSSVSAFTIALRPGVGVLSGALAAAGAGVASFVGASIAAGVFSSAGVGAATFVGRSTNAAIFSSTGLGVFNATGGAVVPAVFSAAGVGAAAWVGAARFAAVFSSAGAGALTATGISTAAAVFNAAGSGVFSGVLRTTFAAVFSSAGIGAFTALSPIPGSVLSASGTGTATFVGRSIASAIFSASGSGVFQGAGNAGVLPFSWGFIID